MCVFVLHQSIDLELKKSSFLQRSNMARKRRAVECVSYLDEDPYEEADERSLMIDLNADSDKGTSKQNKNKQTSAGVKNGLNGVQSNANEVERLRTQLTEERREHRRALFDIRALIDRHIAKVIENDVFKRIIYLFHRLTRPWRMRMIRRRLRR